MPAPRISCSGGFWILLGVLMLALSFRVLLWFALACLVHELGHAGAIRLLGGRTDGLTLTGFGAVLRPRRRRLFSYREECIVALAGPAASFLLALLAAAWGKRFGGDAYLLAGLSLALAVFNLIPAAPLDGGRALVMIPLKVSAPTLQSAAATATTPLPTAQKEPVQLSTAGRAMTRLITGQEKFGMKQRRSMTLLLRPITQ